MAEAPVVSRLEELFGGEIISRSERVPTVSLEGRCEIVGILFSGEWCPPCRGFGQQLKQTYASVTQNNPDRFEIIFVSHDLDQAAFDKYYAKHPWAAIPYEAAEQREKLKRMFKIRDIPHLVLIEARTGKQIKADARPDIRSDPRGERFPWVTLSSEEPTFWKIMTKYSSSMEDGETLMAIKSSHRYTALYCSKKDIAPEENASAAMLTWYNANQRDDLQFVYVSCGDSPEHLAAQKAKFSFPTLNFLEPAVMLGFMGEFRQLYQITQLPGLFIIDNETDELATHLGRQHIAADPTGTGFPWSIEASGVASGIHAQEVNDCTPALLILADNVSLPDEEKSRLLSILEPHGRRTITRAKQFGIYPDLEMLFLLVNNSNLGGFENFGQLLRGLMGINPAVNPCVLVILDMRTQSCYLREDVTTLDAVTQPVVDEFVNDFFEMRLPKKKLATFEG